MTSQKAWVYPRVIVLVACALGLAVAIQVAAGRDANAKLDVLRIGNSGSLQVVGGNEKEALRSLQSFIKEQTGFDNEILKLKDWQELADKLAKRQLELGAFQGFEFAWAVQKDPKLKPLALAVNVYRYPVVYVVAKRDNAATNFAGLKGQSIALPNTGQSYIRLFLEHEATAAGQKFETFFSKRTSPDDIEEALDGVVDGTVQSAAADRAALEGYKRRKPGRFKQLKEVAQSQPFPPPLVAYYEGVLDADTLQKFRQGLLTASNSDRGQTLLTLFRLTGFEAVPDDFDKVLAETRKTYAPKSE
jgi:ABC-type phosphate/phosphonate transport system substrate-binding protein